VALKNIDKGKLRDQQERQVDQDIRIQFRLSHPNIVQCLQSFKDNKKILIVLEYVGKDLFVDHSLQISIIQQVAQGIKHTQENNVIHRGIKLENIFL